MSILVIAEHDNKALNGATLNVVAAAQKIGGDITVLVAGSGAQAVADAAAKVAGVSKVLLADNAVYANQLAENVAALVADIAKGGFKHVLAASTTTGKNILPRVAALLDVSMITDIIAVESANTFKRPIYAGNAIATVQSDEAIIVGTVRGTAFDPVAAEGGSAAVEAVSEAKDAGISKFVAEEIVKSERPELTAARIVVSGGRGVGSGENYHTVLDPLADKLGAAQGASRAAVDAGFVPNDMQVGQTGKTVSPKLYLAFGISGAIQHVSGISGADTIVAINNDPNAEIFQHANYGIVGDCMEVLNDMLAHLK